MLHFTRKTSISNISKTVSASFELAPLCGYQWDISRKKFKS